MKLRSITHEEELALKAATRRALKLGGGAASVQHMVGPDEAMLSRYGGPAHPDRFAKITDAVELDRQCGAPVIVAAMAALLGYRLVAEEEAGAPGGPGGGDIGAGDIAAVFSESAEFAAAVAEAAQDGEITRSEVERVDLEGEGAIRAIRRVQKLARDKAGAKR